MAILAEVTENKCVIESNLHDFAIVVYMPNMADGPSK